MKRVVGWPILMAAALAAVAAAPRYFMDPPQREIPPAIGPHIGLKPSDLEQAETFRDTDHIVMTHFFYWYDTASRAHLVNSDGSDAMTTHPASMADFSYKSVSWHKSQLRDMLEAGIDVVLPVYWGAPSEHDPRASLHWSFTGLERLVEAAEELGAEGIRPPRIGLFYDTTTLESNAWRMHIDLTTDFGKRWFYATIRDFFSLVPARWWAMIEGRPLVVLYSVGFAKAYDQGCIDYVKQEFPRQFGGRVPYIIREKSWRVDADNVYGWGGAIRASVHGVGQLGPGYDHSAVPGRRPLVVPRAGGAHYEQAWRNVLRRDPHIIAIETWNEFHEGTDIAESREYGRKYIELTRKYAELFKRGWSKDDLAGPFSDATRVEVWLGPQNRPRGVDQVEHADGVTVPDEVGGQKCRAIQPTASRGRYVYFIIDDSFKLARSMDVQVEVEYWDDGPGSFTIQYDSHDPTALVGGAYKPCPQSERLTGAGGWKTARFVLGAARLANSQNSMADFRIAVEADRFRLKHVSVARSSAAETR